MQSTALDLSTVSIETKPPPMSPTIGPQIEALLRRMTPGTAVVLSAAIAYQVLLKSLGMGLDVDLRCVPGSDTELRLYRIA